jgi:hypothetical protein
VESVSQDSIQALTHLDLVLIGSTSIPEPLHIDNENSSVHCRPRLRHLTLARWASQKVVIAVIMPIAGVTDKALPLR